MGKLLLDVLVLDDEQDQGELLVDRIGRYDVRHISYITREEGLFNELARHRYSMLFLNTRLNGSKLGCEFVPEIKELYKELIIIGTSQSPSQEPSWEKVSADGFLDMSRITEEYYLHMVMMKALARSYDWAKEYV